ncbi:MAG: hypothetical protein DHS80DRAFT_22512 [Piptocephalis tieghemiana]|nr:MAG: hypothetical protein DHS80DRAFT_22512 [Piptocephalis tieghemiana]
MRLVSGLPLVLAVLGVPQILSVPTQQTSPHKYYSRPPTPEFSELGLGLRDPIEQQHIFNREGRMILALIRNSQLSNLQGTRDQLQAWLTEMEKYTNDLASFKLSPPATSDHLDPLITSAGVLMALLNLPKGFRRMVTHLPEEFREKARPSEQLVRRMMEYRDSIDERRMEQSPIDSALMDQKTYEKLSQVDQLILGLHVYLIACDIDRALHDPHKMTDKVNIVQLQLGIIKSLSFPGLAKQFLPYQKAWEQAGEALLKSDALASLSKSPNRNAPELKRQSTKFISILRQACRDSAPKLQRGLDVVVSMMKDLIHQVSMLTHVQPHQHVDH